MMQLTSILGVPLDCTGRFAGCEKMPDALRAAGLPAALSLPEHGDLPVSISDPTRDAETGLIGFQDVCASSETIRRRVAALLANGEKPLVVGGCCTLLIGVMAAVRQTMGRAGLAFVDGHLDFYEGLVSPTGEAADTELATLVGRGPRALSELAGPAPLVRPEDVAVLGHRDEEENDRYADEARTLGLTTLSPLALRQFGVGYLGQQIRQRFQAEPGRFWLHVDFDVLAVEAMPAVDYHLPGGLQWDELTALVKPLAQSPALLGMDITIYNPNYDRDGHYAKRIVAWVEAVTGA